MTSILGAEAQKHHCAARPTRPVTVAPQRERNSLMGLSNLRLCALFGLPYTATSSTGGTLPAGQQRTRRIGQWTVKYDDDSLVCDIDGPPSVTVAPSVFIGL